MSVELMPSNQLGFNRPLTTLVKKTIHIHNPHPHPIAFKVKTTAPKQYCVRPNSGRVEVGETVEVLVLLQPLAQDPPPHAKCKDKFLVQSAFITPDEEMRSLSEMWANVEKADKSAIHEQKLKCVYLPAEDGAATNGIPEESEEVGDKSRMDESQIFAPAQASPTHANGKSLTPEKAPTPPVAAPTTTTTTQPATTDSQPKEIPSLTASDLKSTVSPTNVALESSILSTTPQSEQTQLEKALKEIERLRAELDEKNGPNVTGLRKRGTVAAGSSATEVATAAGEKVKDVVQGSNGVPLEVVAGLVVGVFVLTYLFF